MLADPQAFIENGPLSWPISTISVNVLLIVIALPELVSFTVPVLELNVKFDPVFGEMLPVASVENNGKHVVSEDSSATVIVVEETSCHVGALLAPLEVIT